MSDAPTPLVSVVLVSYETKDLTLIALRSLLEQAVKHPIEVIVVDNASTDGTAAAITTELPEVRLFELDINVGFARGVNHGARQARGDHILLLNPDTIVHDDVVAELVRFAESRSDLGLLGGRTLATDGTPDPGSCWGLPTPWSLACFGLGFTAVFKGHPVLDPESLGRWPRDTPRDVGLVTGCLLLVRREVWEELGGFDEQFFMYAEDADLAKRAWDLGYRQMITPDAVITHHVGAASKVKSAKRIMVARGKATYVRKHWRGPLAAYGLAMLVLGHAVRAAAHGAIGVVRPGREDRSWWETLVAIRSWIGGWPTLGTT
ncbi:MAG: glycosyltransferase family 2 protein [Actinomycetota bacterium]